MITYPVDVANTKWSVWHKNNGLEYVHMTWPIPNGGALPEDPDGWLTFLLEEETAVPEYDSRYYEIGDVQYEIYLSENRIRFYNPLLERNLSDIKSSLLEDAIEERDNRAGLYSGGNWRTAARLCGVGTLYTRKVLEDRADPEEIEFLDDLEYAMDLVMQIDAAYLSIISDIANAASFAEISTIDPLTDSRWP
jgi:hypothetical protein